MPWKLKVTFNMLELQDNDKICETFYREEHIDYGVNNYNRNFTNMLMLLSLVPLIRFNTMFLKCFDICIRSFWKYYSYKKRFFIFASISLLERFHFSSVAFYVLFLWEGCLLKEKKNLSKKCVCLLFVLWYPKKCQYCYFFILPSTLKILVSWQPQ